MPLLCPHLFMYLGSQLLQKEPTRSFSSYPTLAPRLSAPRPHEAVRPRLLRLPTTATPRIPIPTRDLSSPTAPRTPGVRQAGRIRARLPGSHAPPPPHASARATRASNPSSGSGASNPRKCKNQRSRLWLRGRRRC